MTFVININGTIFPKEDARISVLDRGFLYGDSVYEVIRTYEGHPFAIDEHLQRPEQSAHALAIDIPSRTELVKQIELTLGAAGNDDSYCRVIITRGSGPLTLDPTTATQPTLVILVKPFEPFPKWMYEKGIRMAIPNIRRTSREALDPGIKSGNYLNSVIAFKEARERGFDDAILLDNHNRVTEGTSSNIFALIDDVLATPPVETGLLAGVTRGLMISIANKNDIPCVERQFAKEELFLADEILLTSTLREVMSVVTIDDHKIGTGSPGPMAKRLRKLFQEYALRSVRK